MSMRNDGGPGRGIARIATFLYAVAMLVTVALVLLIGLPYIRPSHTWITLIALLAGETFLYGTVLHYLMNSPGSRTVMPAYLGMGTVAVLYLVVAVAMMLIFSWALDVSAYTYGLLQFIVLGIAAFVMGLMALYLKNAEMQEEGT